jgi:hypothetical protein
MHETTRPILASGEHLPLSALMERYICLCWLSHANGDPGSTEILTGTTILVSDREPGHECRNNANEASTRLVQPLWAIEQA